MVKHNKDNVLPQRIWVQKCLREKALIYIDACPNKAFCLFSVLTCFSRYLPSNTQKNEEIATCTGLNIQQDSITPVCSLAHYTTSSLHAHVTLKAFQCMTIYN